MLRIFRCNRQDVDERVLKHAPYAKLWETELEQQLGGDYSGLIAQPVPDGDYVNFVTPRSGEIDEITEENYSTFAKSTELLNSRSERVYDFLKSGKPLINKELENDRENFAYIVGHAEKSYVLKKGDPLAVPVKLSKTPLWEIRQQKAQAMAAVPPVKGRGCLIPSLLMLLLLLLLLALLWWFFLRPWPMEGTLKDRFDALFSNKTEQIESQQAEDDLLKALEEEAKQRAEEEERLKAEEEAKQKAEEEERLKAEEEAKKKAEEEERLKALEEAKKKAEEEERLKALEEAKKKALEQQKKEEAAKKAEESKKAAKNKIPKCKTLKQEGKMPQMAIAFDGSESMQIQYGYTTRLRAAKTAARDLINSVDKNVSIGLVEINGCPAAKNRGFFDGAKRPALISAVDRINPYAYDGKTPLVNGLNELSRMLDGVKSEAVGILISDGEDTCPFTSNMNVCTVAQKIHQRQPKLKIHTILIGDAIDSAACIARNTGGKVFKPKDASQIQAQLKQAGASLKKVCED